MTIRGIEEKVSKMRGKPASQKDVKPVKVKTKKEKLTVYIQREEYELLRAYAFQKKSKLSHVVSGLIEEHVRPEVKKSLLKL